MIFFPTVLSNSIAVMLLPSISRAKEEGRNYYIRHSITVGFFLCMFLGFLCSFFFYFSIDQFSKYTGYNSYIFRDIF